MTQNKRRHNKTIFWGRRSTLQCISIPERREKISARKKSGVKKKKNTKGDERCKGV